MVQLSLFILLKLNIHSVYTFLRKELLVGLQNRLHVVCEEFVDLFGSTPYKQHGFDQSVQLGVDGLKHRILGDTLHQVVWFPFTLDNGPSSHGVDTNSFVQLLSVTTSLYTC
jgi:hypothetical protein